MLLAEVRGKTSSDYISQQEMPLITKFQQSVHKRGWRDIERQILSRSHTATSQRRKKLSECVAAYLSQ